MIYSFHPEAEEKFCDVIAYYEERSEGLVLDFALSIQSAIQRAMNHPKSWPVVEGEIRRCQATRLPHGVLYS